MSRTRLFAFVEGFSDRYFYDRICASVCADAGVSYEVRTAEEIPGGAGGKESLLQLFDQLRTAGGLLENWQGKRHAVLFFLDKDLDEYKRRRRRSSHVVYTAHYHVENYWFIHGDLHAAAAIASGLDVDTVVSGLGDPALWRAVMARRWRGWVELCFQAQLDQIPCECTYRTNSKINPTPESPTDAVEYARLLNAMERASGLPAAQFRKRTGAVRRIVGSLYRRGLQDRVFRGKWYTTCLAYAIERLAGARGFKRVALPDRIQDALLGTLRFDASWADEFRTPLRALVG